MVAPFLPEKEKVAAIRDELPAIGAGIYLDAATAGPLPVGTDRAMREWAEWELRVGRAGDVADEEFAARLDETRAAIAAILVSGTDRVRLAPSMADALVETWARRRWSAGERVVVVGTVEPAFRAAIGALAGISGADVASVDDAGSDTSASLPAQVLDAAGSAAIVCVAHVSPATGRAVRVDELARVTHTAGGWLVVDGSSAVGAIAIDVTALDADVYLAATDRWLCGPSGVGVLWNGPRTDERGSSTRDPKGFEGGLNRAAVVGVGRSAGWLAMQVGLEWAYERTARLAAAARDALARIDGVTVSPGPDDDAAGSVVFRISGWSARQAREQLHRRAFALVGTTPAGDALRLGLGCWNTEEEIGTLGAAVVELAAAAPDTLPPRPPTLVIQDPE